MKVKSVFWRYLSVLCILMFSAGMVFAQEDVIDEDAMFAEDDTMVALSNVQDEGIYSNLNKESVTFAGTIYNRSSYYMTRDWLTKDATGDSNRLSTYVEGDFLLDVRLRSGIKAFANLSAYYSPGGQVVTHTFVDVMGSNSILLETNYTALVLKEFFVDVNLFKTIYFRMGKQVLQWGRGYFWQPTDLINVEKKNFLDLERSREGAYGLKMHIPYKTILNFYGFLDMGGVENFDDIALAGKIEVVLGHTELALSAWAKQGYLPIYGFDFSTRLLGFDFRGEMSFSSGENKKKLGEAVVVGPFTNYTTTQTFDEFIPKIVLQLSRTFTLSKPDQLSVVFEFFYNHSGYYENVFEDDAKAMAVMINSLYQPNYHGVYYASLFTSISSFFDPNLTFSLNAMANCSDWSAILTTGLSYTPVFNFTCGLNVYAFIGEDKTEYVLSGNGLGADMTLTLKF